ncbi:IQ-DOMAIN 31-like protein [Drosera capensis]
MKRSSPGKWIKSVLFGKKSSKSDLIKHKEPGTLKVVNGSSKAPENLPAFIPPVGWKCVEDENGLCCSLDLDKLNLGSERRKDFAAQQNGETRESGHQNDEAEQPVVSERERIRLEKAATKVQAAFRGYLSRRAFKALKGIMRLQALIRGHLVRRQAASTLFCVIGIVRLQAIARGSRIRCADVGLEVRKDNSLPGPSGFDLWKKIASSSGSAFVRKVVALLPTVNSLQILYESADPNSHVNWLERWSMSCPWKPAPSSKKPRIEKYQKMQGTPQTVENASGKPKGSIHKVHSSIASTSSQVANDFGKPHRSLKKAPSNSAESLQENPQGELERIRHNLKKVQSTVTESLVQPEVVNEESNENQGKWLTETESTIQPVVSNEKPNQNQDKSSNSNCHDVSVVKDISESEDVKDETATIVNEGTRGGDSLKSNDTVESSSISDQSVVVTRSPPERNVKDENVPPSNEKSKSKEDSPLVKYQKSARRVTFPIKRDRLATIDAGVQNIPRLPSYMAATESAKAKLRGLGSPRLSQNGTGQEHHLTRHPLPYTNGKLSSPSPRTLKPAQVSGKGGNKKDRSLLLHTDAKGKLVQAE